MTNTLNTEHCIPCINIATTVKKEKRKKKQTTAQKRADYWNLYCPWIKKNTCSQWYFSDLSLGSDLT